MMSDDIKRTVASICMWQIRNYYRDLAEYYNGDDGRFSRMVVDQGKALQSASPQGWAKHIATLAPQCVQYHASELRTIFTQIAAWNLTVDHSILSEVTHV